MVRRGVASIYLPARDDGGRTAGARSDGHPERWHTRHARAPLIGTSSMGCRQCAFPHGGE
eukprot:1909767-Prymnesium_polylepis.2